MSAKCHVPHVTAMPQLPEPVSSRFVPTDVSYPDDSYPILVGLYPSLWSIRTLVNNHEKKAF